MFILIDLLTALIFCGKQQQLVLKCIHWISSQTVARFASTAGIPLDKRNLVVSEMDISKFPLLFETDLFIVLSNFCVTLNYW